VEFLRRKEVFARAPRPDLILLDLELPKMHGREVLTEIRSDVELQDIPVVILTISKDHEDILRNQGLHVEAYLAKPVDFATFVAVVKELKKVLAADIILPVIE
jgi:CheY-like chemotaxis protein